jgi:hypothetical protein
VGVLNPVNWPRQVEPPGDELGELLGFDEGDEDGRLDGWLEGWLDGWLDGVDGGVVGLPKTSNSSTVKPLLPDAYCCPYS